MLAALEKRDAEGRLRADREILVHNAVRVVKMASSEETEGNVTSLELNRKVTEERKACYESRDYMNSWEIAGTVIEGASAGQCFSVSL